MTCGVSVSLEDFLPFTSSRVIGHATTKLGKPNEPSSERSHWHEVANRYPLGLPTKLSHARYGAILPVSGAQGSR